jgi:DNA (cytosine-5)-methyltransferase 1
MEKRVAPVDEVRRLRERAGLTIEQVAAQTGYSSREVYRWDAGEVAPRKTIVELLKRSAVIRESSSNPQDFRFIDLFAGIGGMRLGFEGAGGKCVFTSEWNEAARKTYTANFTSEHAIWGDINDKEVLDHIPDHDVLLAGFPCQPFSIAGVSKKNALGRPHGFACEAQGTLFFRIAEILKARRPAAFVLENVKNLKSHDKRNTFRVIQNVLENELGYEIHERVIDARVFVPQHRERIFIVGFREGTRFQWERDLQLLDIRKAPTLGSILHTEDGSEDPEFPFTEGPKAKVASKYTLTRSLWEYLKGYAEKHRNLGHGFGFGLFGPKDVARTLSARYYKDGSEILIRRKSSRPRRLTPRECARLMGFDSEARVFRIPVSDTQAYRQFGNAVVVPVVEAVAKAVSPHVLGVMRGEVYPRTDDRGQFSFAYELPEEGIVSVIG